MTDQTTLRATINDGRTAVLYADGTWRLVEDSDSGTLEPTEAGFRKSSWGMSMSDVERVEARDEMVRGEGFLFHEARIADMPCEIYFIFARHQLIRGRVRFTVEHSNATDFIYDFDRIKDLMSKKYGSALKDEEIWKDDLYQDDPSEWGMAIGNGGLVKFATWAADDTDITLLLSGDNYEIFFAIDYVSKRFGHLENQQKEEQALDEL